VRPAVSVDDPELFEHALAALKGRTHGDTLAVYLALKKHSDVPRIGASAGVSSGTLEQLLDDFYTKVHPDLGPRSGQVCRIFHDSFTAGHSYSQNNWRDFFRYALGVSCLAPEHLFATEFLTEHRSHCRYLVCNSKGDYHCKLHPRKTRYIRGLDKPKLLHWSNPGPAGRYKVADLGDPRLVEVIRPLSIHVPLESLIVALYFGAAWHSERNISFGRFAADFGFEDGAQVEYLFASDVVDPGLRRMVARRSLDLLDALKRPLVLKRTDAPDVTSTERRVRDAAFRMFVRAAYDSACAACGQRVETEEGKWEVQAAHIYPHRLGGVDDVRNGLALCHNHHWAFDEGLFTVGEDYELIWKETARRTQIHVSGKLRLPDDPKRWPDQDQALAWHRKRHFGEPLLPSNRRRRP